MSMLIEKRTELIKKLNSLETARQIDIDAKVEAYRQTIEMQTPKDEINKVKAVISALDEVIAYDESVNTTVEAVPMTEHTVVNEARPGMTNIAMPSRM